MLEIRAVWKILFKWISKKLGLRFSLDFSGSNYSKIKGSCECGNEILCFTKYREFRKCMATISFSWWTVLFCFSLCLFLSFLFQFSVSSSVYLSFYFSTLVLIFSVFLLHISEGPMQTVLILDTPRFSCRCSPLSAFIFAY